MSGAHAVIQTEDGLDHPPDLAAGQPRNLLLTLVHRY